ncbi:MAG: hypothetical protein IJB86_00290 [Clostridia bacterium]|nr:hypothetical protein [Clostridia bacterium]
MNRLLYACLIPLIFIQCSVQVYAWVPKHYVHCEVNSENIPKDAVCLELLVRKSDIGDSCFVEDSGSCVLPSVGTDSQIGFFDDDGFVSYTLHCKDSGSETVFQNKQDDIYITRYCLDRDYGGESNEAYETVKKLRKIRFAYLDKDGNVLQLTDKVSIRYYIPFRGYLDIVCIDGDNVTVTYEGGPKLWLIPYLSAFVIIFIVASVFGNRSKKKA